MTTSSASSSTTPPIDGSSTMWWKRPWVIGATLVAILAMVVGLFIALQGGNSSTTSPKPTGIAALPVVSDHLKPLIALGDQVNSMPDTAAKESTYGPQLDQKFTDIRRLTNVDHPLVRYEAAGGYMSYNAATRLKADISDAKTVAAHATANGTAPMVIVTGSFFDDPAWKTGEYNSSDDPTLLAYFTSVVSQLHQDAGVNVFAYGNELNFAVNAPNQVIDPARDAHVAQVFAQAVHGVSPTLKAGFGSVGPANPDAHKDNLDYGMTMDEYMRKAIAAGLDQVDFAGINVACFGDPASNNLPGPNCQAWQDAFSLTGPSVYRDFVTAYPQKEVKLTEFTGGTLDVAGQAASLRTAYALLRDGDYPRLGDIGWFSYDNFEYWTNGLATNKVIRDALWQCVTHQADLCKAT